MHRSRVSAWTLAAFLFAGGCGGSGGNDDGGGGGPVVDAGPPLLAYVLATANQACDNVGAPCASRLEVFDLETQQRTLSLDLPGVEAEALAVAPGGSRFYVADRRANQVRAFDLAGVGQGTAACPSAYDLALSPDGSLLYAVGALAVHEIDATTMAVNRSLPLSHEALGLAVSPDGGTLAIPASLGVDGQRVILVAAATLTSPGAIPITSSGVVCADTFDAATFDDDGDVYVWDGGCNFFVTLDPLTLTERTAEVRTLPDPNDGIYGFSRHCIAAVPGRSETWVAIERGDVIVVPPHPAATATIPSSLLGGRAMFPRPSPDAAHVAVVVTDFSSYGVRALDAATQLPAGGLVTSPSPSIGVLADLRIVPKLAP